MSDDTKRISNTELNTMVEQYLSDGGEITRLRYASQKDVNTSRRTMFHKDKAISGSEQSKDVLAREETKEATMIFSKTDRWKEGG
jgi:hypothetical protein